MRLKMKMPCELIVWYVLPSIRRDLAAALKKKGMAQKEIAEKLGVTPAAVSQYGKARRALSKFKSHEMDVQIERLAEEIAAGRIKNIQPGICAVCGVCKKTPVLESVYKKYGGK